VGTANYVSPEMIDKKKYSFATDLWAFGVIVYQLYSDNVPFQGKNQDATFDMIKEGQYEMQESIPALAQDLIRKLLILEPRDRLGALRIEDLINHPLFEGINFEKIKDEKFPMELELSKYQQILFKYLP
jgi:serine/threonine protein kinase